MERPNLGKPFSPAMLNNLPDTRVALPKNISYPKVASAVLSTPRHNGSYGDVSFFSLSQIELSAERIWNGMEHCLMDHMGRG